MGVCILGWNGWAALLPSICLALLFWLVMHFILGLDRKEREAHFKALERKSPDIPTPETLSPETLGTDSADKRSRGDSQQGTLPPGGS